MSVRKPRANSGIPAVVQQAIPSQAKVRGTWERPVPVRLQGVSQRCEMWIFFSLSKSIHCKKTFLHPCVSQKGRLLSWKNWKALERALKCSFQFNVRIALRLGKMLEFSEGEMLFVTARVWPFHSQHICGVLCCLRVIGLRGQWSFEFFTPNSLVQVYFTQSFDNEEKQAGNKQERGKSGKFSFRRELSLASEITPNRMKWDLTIKTIRLVLTGLHKHRFRRISILAAEENLRLFPRSGKRKMTDFRKMPCANGAPPFSYRNMKTCFVWFIWYLTLGKKSKEAQHPLPPFSPQSFFSHHSRRLFPVSPEH